MSVTTAKKRKKPSAKKKVVSATRKMKDYRRDPFFVKKTKDAVAFLKKHGLPQATT